MSQEIIGFVLHKRPYQSTSELVDILSDEFGVLRVVAKHQSKLRAPLQSFTRYTFTISGAGELKKLISYEVKDRYREYGYENILLLTYINEITLKLTPYESVMLCEMYYYVLEHITNDSLNNQYILRIFETHLLAELGFALDFSRDNTGNAIKADTQYAFEESTGFYVLEGAKGILGADIHCFLKDKIPSKEGLLQYKHINQRRLAQVLGTRQLESRKLFKALKTHK